MKTLPVDYLIECFVYDVEAGILRWRERPRHHFDTDQAWKSSIAQVAGKVVASGNTKGKYAYVMVDKTPYLVHRICFAMHFGYWPVEVDHRDGNTRNNRADNLRAATRKQNGQNTGLRTTNLSGIKGISRKPGKNLKKPWYGRVKVDGKSLRTAYFATAEEAYRAYLSMADEHFGEFARPLRGTNG